MRRKLTILFLGTMLGGASASAEELTVWDWKSGDPATQTYYEKAKANFETAHPGVTVNYVMQPNDQYYTLLGTALSSNAGPDLFLMNGGAQARARMDALVKLDDKVADVSPARMAGSTPFRCRSRASSSTTTRSSMPTPGSIRKSRRSTGPN
jgi:raffinose/stachyose/melibiose transport system substrate-binding protein